MELWDILDENRIPTGETVVRGDRMQKGQYHTVVHVCIFNSKKEMLIQKRQPFKEGWSGMWDVSVGGSAVSGDSSRQAAEREVMEELGIEIDLDGLRPSFTINFDTGFDDFYLIQKDVDIQTLKLQYEEVEKAEWASLQKIQKMQEEKTFIPYHKNLIPLLFEMVGKTGAIDD